MLGHRKVIYYSAFALPKYSCLKAMMRLLHANMHFFFIGKNTYGWQLFFLKAMNSFNRSYNT